MELHFFDDNWQPDPAGLNFRGAGLLEVDNNSAVVKGAWLRWARSGTSTWGKFSNLKIVAWDATKPIGEPDANTYQNADYWPLPPGSRSVTFEGRRENAAVVPSAWILLQAK